ncbi:unnamed protein product [Gongylonema pulchrum]|uniref:DNA_MISMATCH_REPAIR_2 domain-containing protein n=1 Tax=Gongylonema pulchrum TaxID=637853 RepID=A0A183DQW2_9BILA|nr:unnamed protein product [Gongylonema pulchrum]
MFGMPQAGYASAFCELAQTFAVIDVLVALAVLAATSPFGYVRPQLHTEGHQILDLRSCRHPVMEATPNSPQFIPNDIVLGNEQEDEARFLMLTGANMGGKSTYLRCCALTVLLAQIGSFVPCSSARFSLIDGIYTRDILCRVKCFCIYATHYHELTELSNVYPKLLKNVCTAFQIDENGCLILLYKIVPGIAGHSFGLNIGKMVGLSESLLQLPLALQSATCNSLVIVDELGRGTSTYDGFGLAWAIAEDILCRVKCFCIYATHYHELTELSNIYPKLLKNVCTAFQIDENGCLILLYKIVPGIAGHSFGLNIGKMVGLSESLLQGIQVKNKFQAAGNMLESLEPKNIHLSAYEREKYQKISSLCDDDLRRQILESPLDFC